MTINWCRIYCKDQNFIYAGLKGGNACVCKNDITQVPENDRLCGRVCAGNSDQVCGGDTTFSIYHGKYFKPLKLTKLLVTGDAQ